MVQGWFLVIWQIGNCVYLDVRCHKLNFYLNLFKMYDNDVALRIKYFVLGTEVNHFEGEEDLASFKAELHKTYFATFETEFADRGGGGNFLIEFLLDITLKDYLMIVASGLAWDIVKLGAQNYLIRPFIKLYKKFRANEASQKIEEINLVFRDSRIIITTLNPRKPEIDFELVQDIINAIAQNYSKLLIDNSIEPNEIHVPLIKDNISSTKTIYRYVLSVDEPLIFNQTPPKKFSNEDYFMYWGLKYLGWRKYVYNVKAETCFESDWYTDENYPG